MNAVGHLRVALRRLLRRPVFTAAAGGTLAVGIGTSVALWSVVDGVLLRPLPYPRAHEIVRVYEVGDPAKGGARQNMSDPNFADLRAGARGLAGMAQYAAWMVSATFDARSPAGAPRAERLPAGAVSRDFFAVYGVAPVAGRLFAADEMVRDGAPAALVAESFWREALGAEPDLSSLRLTAEGETFDVVGVVPAGFEEPDGARVWVPRERYEALPSRTALNWRVVGRLAPGVSLGAARAELGTIARRLKGELGDQTWMWDADVVPLQEAMVGRVRTALLLLLGAGGLLFLISCANVLNLVLARAAARRAELVVRQALGAGRRALAAEFLGETLLVALGGALAGAALAAALVRALHALAPANLPRSAEIRLDAGAAVLAVALAAVAALALALALARAAGRGAPTVAGGRGVVQEHGAQRWQRLLVAVQLGLATVLVGGGTLLGRSMVELLRLEPGYEIAGRVGIELYPPGIDGEDGSARAARARLVRELEERLAALPGVRSAGAAGNLPLAAGLANGTFILARPDETIRDFEDFGRVMRLPERSGSAHYAVATEGYFRALEIPLLRGRLFDGRDTADAPHAALVSASLAARTWPGEDPIGRLVQYGNMDGDLRPMTVVGVVGDARYESLETGAEPVIYAALAQRPQGARNLSFVLDVTGDPGTVLAAAQRVVRDLAPEAPPRLRRYEAILERSLAQRSFLLRLVAAFALAALVLAATAAGAVAALGVARRRREMGVRLACGAPPVGIVRLVLAEQARLAATGLVAGMAVALALARALRSQLWGIAPADPLALLATICVLLAVVLLATAAPALRAARTDPVAALRAD